MLMMRLMSLVIATLPTIAMAQSVVVQPAPPATKFEVVSIRRVKDPSGLRPLRITPRGQLLGISDLRNIVHLAYGAEPFERTVAASPTASRYLAERFEVTALPPKTVSVPTREAVLQMIRQMLADRFKLNVRIDTELVNATVLRVIKPGALGPGLRSAPEGCTAFPIDAHPGDADAYRRSCALTLRKDQLRGTVTLDQFARVVSVIVQRPILDKTNLQGLFTVDIEVAANSLDLRYSEPSDAPAFADAAREQMGLTIQVERQPVRLFVVDHVEPLIEN